MGQTFKRDSGGRLWLWCAACLILGAAWTRADRLQDLRVEGKNTEEVLRVKAVIEGAIREEPANSELWVHLGLVNRKLDRLEEARQAFERAAELNPRNANAHFMLGLLYEKTGQKDRAVAAWEGCLQNATEDGMRGIAEKHLKVLRGR